MTTLQEFYNNVASNVRSSASEYARTLEADKARNQIASTRFVASATSGVTALDAYTKKIKAQTAKATQVEVLARALLTGVYGVQCRTTVLAEATGASFTANLTDPSKTDDDFCSQLEKALITMDRVNKLLKFVSLSCATVSGVNKHARHAIEASISEVDEMGVPEEMRIELALNNHRDESLDTLAAVVKLIEG